MTPPDATSLTSADIYEKIDIVNIKLAKELAIIKDSLDSYTYIGLNASSLRGKPGYHFLSLAQETALRTVVVGIESVFETARETDELCSLSGLCRLVAQAEIKSRQAIIQFARNYGQEPSGDWKADLEAVRRNQRPVVLEHMRLTSRFRNERLAHLSHPSEPASYSLPGVGHLENLLSYAIDFYQFIHRGFVDGIPADIQSRTEVKNSVLSVLKAIGVESPVTTFADDPPSRHS